MVKRIKITLCDLCHCEGAEPGFAELKISIPFRAWNELQGSELYSDLRAFVERSGEEAQEPESLDERIKTRFFGRCEGSEPAFVDLRISIPFRAWTEFQDSGLYPDLRAFVERAGRENPDTGTHFPWVECIPGNRVCDGLRTRLYARVSAPIRRLRQKWKTWRW